MPSRAPGFAGEPVKGDRRRHGAGVEVARVDRHLRVANLVPRDRATAHVGRRRPDELERRLTAIEHARREVRRRVRRAQIDHHRHGANARTSARDVVRRGRDRDVAVEERHARERRVARVVDGRGAERVAGDRERDVVEAGRERHAAHEHLHGQRPLPARRRRASVSLMQFGARAGRRAQHVRRRRRREEHDRRHAHRDVARVRRASSSGCPPCRRRRRSMWLWPSAKATLVKVATPAAKFGDVSVSVVLPFVIVSVTSGVSVAYERSVTNVATGLLEAAAEVGGRRDGDRRRRRVDPQVERRALARRRRRVGHVDAQLGRGRTSAPVAVSTLSGSVTLMNFATKPRPFGQLSAATAATVATPPLTRPSARVAGVAREERRGAGAARARDHVGLRARRGAVLVAEGLRRRGRQQVACSGRRTSGASVHGRDDLDGRRRGRAGDARERRRRRVAGAVGDRHRDAEGRVAGARHGDARVDADGRPRPRTSASPSSRRSSSAGAEPSVAGKPTASLAVVLPHTWNAPFVRPLGPMKSPECGFETVRSGAVMSTGYEPLLERPTTPLPFVQRACAS